ncbi:hypothetical protein [Corallococcus sp. CA047B]|uniref:hypothetical protein n=1 Tax=Corallococcus sp. CA047B TaxID=2316729 RepID=UPI001F226309|nr:hypothetical protein [Corallococcus sp. CA047B]
MASFGSFKLGVPLILFLGGCAASTPPTIIAPDAEMARGPWSEVPSVVMPAGDASIPIDLLRDVAEAMLKLPGAKACDAGTRRPIAGLSTEYCSTVYVAGSRDSLFWRVAEPIRGSHEACKPFFVVKDDDFPSSQVWVVGYVHNHPCAAAPSSQDLSVWPTDVLKPFVSMAEVRLIPGNPAPALFKSSAIEMASALVAERQDGTRLFLRYFPTGEVQQWSDVRARWVTLGVCAPRSARPPFRSVAPECRTGGLQLLRD